jgi:hypothetical protein
VARDDWRDDGLITRVGRSSSRAAVVGECGGGGLGEQRRMWARMRTGICHRWRHPSM